MSSKHSSEGDTKQFLNIEINHRVNMKCYTMKSEKKKRIIVILNFHVKYLVFIYIPNDCHNNLFMTISDIDLRKFYLSQSGSVKSTKYFRKRMNKRKNNI